MTDQRRSSAAETYWESVAAAAQSTHDQKRWRAEELQRLKTIAQGYRDRWFPELPELTIEAIPLGGHSSAMVDKLGGWGQGISIRVKHSRIDPFHWPPAHAEMPTLAAVAKDRSLIFGAPLRRNPQGEQLRQFEAELLILQQLLRAEQHRVVEVKSLGWGSANSDLTSWGGNGEWFANEANRVWKEWCSDKGFPFHPVRHSRANYEGLHECNRRWEAHVDDQPLTFIRQSCSKWPAIVMGQAREVDLRGECPDMLGAEDYATAVTPEQWARWKREQGELESARLQLVDIETTKFGVVWPDNQLPQIDEIDGEFVVSMPAKATAIPMSRKVDLNYNPGDALRLIEAVFKPIDVDRGLTLWPDFLQLAADHPESPKASRVQTELAVDLDDDDLPAQGESTPIEAGEADPVVLTEPEPEAPAAVMEIDGFELLQAVRHKRHGQGVITKLFPSTFGKGNAGIDFDGSTKIVSLSELTPIEAGESFTAQRWPTTDGSESDSTPIEAGEAPSIEPASSSTTDSEPSQSQLRKEPEQAHHDGLPAWPTNSKSQGSGQRVRPTHEQVAVLEEQIQVRLDQGVKPAEIKRELSPWCGQRESTLAIRIRQMSARVEAGQEVAA